MKLSIGKRMLMFAHWLFSLLICAALVVSLIAPDALKGAHDGLEASMGLTGVRILGIALLAVYLALAIAQAYLIFKRKKRDDRGFIIMESSETGRVRISVAAIEQMVRQSVHSIDGISEMKINIDNAEDAIAIGVNATIVNGRHVPTITNNMKRSIRQFVEMNCGVAVQTVSISINAVTNAGEPNRRRFGRGKGEAAKPLNPQDQKDDAVNAELKYAGEALDEDVQPVEADAPETPTEESVTEEVDITEEKPTGFSRDADPEIIEQTEVYDFDRPYESQFAKDLAAMKAQDAVDTEDDALSSWRDEA